MTEIVELEGHVFEVILEPDAPGYRPRTLTIRQLSGQEIPAEVWHRAGKKIARRFRKHGVLIRRIEFGERGAE